MIFIILMDTKTKRQNDGRQNNAPPPPFFKIHLSFFSIISKANVTKIITDELIKSGTGDGIILSSIVLS